MRLYRRIRLACCAAFLLGLALGEPLLCALLCGAYVACMTYAAGDVWLSERERSVRR